MEQYAKTDYVGIDYGRGLSNINQITSIRFGVIPHQDIGSAWYDEAEAHYGDPACPECDSAPEDYDDDVHKDYKIDPYTCSAEYACEECKMIFDSEQAYPEEPLSWFFKNAEYEAEQTDEVDIFIFKSPFFTYAQLASPCAPGACYLPLPLYVPDMNNRCYCLGPKWFEDEVAPYPVYSVETNKMVQPA